MIKLETSSADPLAQLADIKERIRKEPQRVDLRVFLFQIYCVQGEWGKAGNQLNTLLELDAETKMLAATYTEVLRCEALRKEIFDGTRSPMILGDPAEWMAWLVEALKLNAQGRHAEARALRDRAFEAAPASEGSIDGEEFDWLADADSRLGPVLEVVVNGKYYWLPMQRLARCVLEAPADLRDLVWMPATLTLVNGGEMVAFIPTRYPGTETSSDHPLLLARRTEWRELGSETYAGLGQRMFTSDRNDHALLDVREILLKPAADG